jgi:uncharacterized repeat protein (TIGR03803 family)
MMTVGIRASLIQSSGQRRRAWLMLLVALAPCLLACPAILVAGPISVLHTFTAPEFPDASPVTNWDGLAPASSLLPGSDGYFYGTTWDGGDNGAGSIFCMSATGSLSNLYSFPAATNDSGEVVYDLGPGDLALGTNGNIYGTTRSGGSNFSGTIFEISPSGSFATLHTFGAETTRFSGRATSVDGAAPTGALVLGKDGNFYGTTEYGGSNNMGTIFQITPAGVFTSLYSLKASAGGSATTNGSVANALTLGSNGAFYGTTQQGGVDNAGTFFKFTVAGGFTQIYSFNGLAPGSNPITPDSALVQGTNGNFYGASAFGGSQGGGSIFEITNTGGVTLLHSFPQLNAGAGAALSLGADGSFYGTVPTNGFNGSGTLFRMTPAGDFGAYSFSPLDAKSDNADGADPSAALTADGAGGFYGTCAAGGTNGSGVIFQIGPDFIPPYFLTLASPPPGLTNVLVGASVIFSYQAQGLQPMIYQWLRDGTNLTDGGDIFGSLSNTLRISPVFPRDVGSYALLISNTWGALTSAVTVLTVTPPGVAISSPTPNARTSSPVFAGTATNAPFSSNANPDAVGLTNVIYSITNLFNGSNITGLAAVTTGAGGASNWTFAVTPFPGTNILSVQSLDVSGNVSPAAYRVFFYEMPARLTVLATGSGTGTFSVANGEMLDVGQSYSDTASPVSSVFNYWVSNGVIIGYGRTLSFVMQSNLVLTADFTERQSPAVSITAPAEGARTTLTDFKGTAASAPLLAGVNSNNVRLADVVYWLTNAAAGSVISNLATLTQGTAVSNWSIAATPSPGTNTLAVQCEDLSGDRSPIVFHRFFYKVPALFTLLKSGTGNGTFTAAAAVGGDTLPTNGAMLNLGESYTVTARPDPFSTFSKWVGPNGSSSTPTLSFIMAPGFALTAIFDAIAPRVAISSPAANLRSPGPAFKGSGTASGHFPITDVIWSLENSFTVSSSSGSATLTASAGGGFNWSIALDPSPGPNVLTVYCVDVNSNQSAAVSRKFFYEVRSRLTVTNAGSGNGTFKGAASVAGNTLPADGAMLNLGENYTITAMPDKFSLFSNWVSSAGFGGDTPALPFVMHSNLVLTVTFITNFFPPVAGTYNGLFYPAAAVSEAASGMLYNLALGKTGAFSGKLLMAGTNYPFSNKFDASGHANFDAGPVPVALTLDREVPQITGTVSASPLTARWASRVLPSAEYTVLFSPTTDVSAVSPPGDGYALVTNHAGVVTLSGELADGTHYDQTVPVSQAGDLPVFASLYTTARPGAGLLLGWINLTNLQAAAPSSALAWIKNPLRSPARYTNGFTNTLSVHGALWTNPPANTSAISLSNGELVISNAGLLLTYTNIAVRANSLKNLGALPTNSLTGSINPKTGLLTLTFAHGKTTQDAWAAILQDTTNAGGFFLTPTNAGSLELQP